ncbi:MAG: DUF481 domain-containing protein [bacterium]|nr:DUF481 domain-containing protein [bacterium]
MHTNPNLRLFLFLFVCLLTAPVYADRLFTSNGDRLSGTLTGWSEDGVRFESELAGPVVIEASRVQTLQTAAPFALLLTDGARLIGALEPVDASDEVYVRLTDDKVARVKIADVVRGATDEALLNPPEPEPEPVAQEAPADTAKPWKGSVSLLAGARSGNKEAIDFYLKSKAEKSFDSMELTLRGDAGYGQSQSKVDTEELRLQGDLKKFLDDNLYLFGDQGFEYDRPEGIQLRSESTAGVGYRFWNTKRSELSTDFGAGVLYERYLSAGDNVEPSLRASLEYRQTFWEATELSELLTVYPRLGTLGSARLMSSTGLKQPITDTLSWTMNLDLDFETDPVARNIDNMDLAFRSGLQYQF